MKQILLPLALVIGAITVFELGARYGASNVRAVAVAAQLQTFLNYYAATSKDADIKSVEQLEQIIDHHIATAALQRDHWVLKLKQEPRGTLDRTLRNGLSVRGDEVLEHFAGANSKIENVAVAPDQLQRIKSAIAKAKRELITGE